MQPLPSWVSSAFCNSWVSTAYLDFGVPLCIQPWWEPMNLEWPPPWFAPSPPFLEGQLVFFTWVLVSEAE